MDCGILCIIIESFTLTIEGLALDLALDTVALPWCMRYVKNVGNLSLGEFVPRGLLGFPQIFLNFKHVFKEK